MRPWLALTGLLFIGAAHGQSLQESVTAVWVHDVPGPPQGDFWHPVAEHILSSFTGPASIYPNVEVCARPLRVRLVPNDLRQLDRPGLRAVHV
jgi:hypothetical protein